MGGIIFCISSRQKAKPYRTSVLQKSRHRGLRTRWRFFLGNVAKTFEPGNGTLREVGSGWIQIPSAPAGDVFRFIPAG